MPISSDLSKVIAPFVQQYRGQHVLLAGSFAQSLFDNQQDTRLHSLGTPFTLDQLKTLPPIDLAVISDVVEQLAKPKAIQWLASLRNQYAQHVLLIVDQQQVETTWQLTDYLALGLKLRGHVDHYTLYSYAIEDYQFKKDWLNSRYWANPENFDKFRW